MLSNPCDGFALVGLKAGDGILMSTSTLGGGGPSTWNTAVWKIDRSRLRLAVLSGKDFPRVWFTDDRRIARADTLVEALALVAPRASQMPTTSTDLPAMPGAYSIWSRRRTVAEFEHRAGNPH